MKCPKCHWCSGGGCDLVRHLIDEHKMEHVKANLLVDDLFYGHLKPEKKQIPPPIYWVFM